MNKAIEIKGIARSQTKLSGEDGQCEDLVNLRFKDGSWRVSTDGKYVYSMDKQYKDMHIHTNSTYRHILGVDPEDNTLYWFANIGEDGETFESIERVAILNDIQGDVTIEQTGHLIIIAYKGYMRYAIFVTTQNEYRVIDVNANGDADNRVLYPFGNIHINWDDNVKVFEEVEKEAGDIVLDDDSFNFNDSGALLPKEDEESTKNAAMIWHSSMLKVYNKAKEENYFTNPLLAIVAAKLYDGSYVYASNPIFLSPIEKYSSYKTLFTKNIDEDSTSYDKLCYAHNAYKIGDNIVEINEEIRPDQGNMEYFEIINTPLYYYRSGESLHKGDATRLPVYRSGASAASLSDHLTISGSYPYKKNPLTSVVVGSQLIMSLGDIKMLLNNSDVFQGLSVFVTRESELYNMSAEGYKNGTVEFDWESKKNEYSAGLYNRSIVGNVTYRPEIRSDEEIIYDLMHSPFYLLREYTIDELRTMNNTSTLIDLTEPQYEGLLKSITTQDVLTNEALERKSFDPKFIYNYNQRLHIANYDAKQFYGYPVDLFQLSNHNVHIEEGSNAINGVLPNMKDGEDYQYKRAKTYFASTDSSHMPKEEVDGYISKCIDQGTCFAAVGVTIETQQGEQKVCRFIKPYDSNISEQWKANFMESLSPILAFPDARATKMNIKLVSLYEDKVNLYEQEFKLKPHLYLNLAYYIDGGLKPIDLPLVKTLTKEQFNGSADMDFKAYENTNNIESFTNGVKVSITSNPFTFPNSSTYQIGNGEIIAMMSNAVAVGTGQTGAAPLYVFCKDGIYALMVDSSGEMAYTNARIIARDVCNNAKSVTPVDTGVVFTTDRGIMEIAGEQVAEIGQIVEGEVYDITDHTDKAKKIMFNSFVMQQLAELPQEMLDNVDFLDYLKGSIINYNHNERELMVSNPSSSYSYIMNRNGEWRRQDIKANQYVNNYPTSYRVENNSWYKVDEEDTTKDENSLYVSSQVIKLDTTGFKALSRIVVRGCFNVNKNDNKSLGLYVFGSYDGRQWALIGGNEKQGDFTDIGCTVARSDIKFVKLVLAGTINYTSRIDFVEIEYSDSQLNTKVR